MKTLLLNTVVGISDIIPKAIGKASCTVPEAYESYLDKFYIMHICLSGEDVVRIDGEKFNISAGKMFITHPCQRLVCSGEKMSVIYG